MAKREKKKSGPAYTRGRSFRVILPPDISARVEKEARDEGRPQSRVIINHLARIPYLDAQARLGELVREMGSVLARHEERAPLSGLGEEQQRAVDALLEAPTEAQREALERLRVTRMAMLEIERRTAQIEREQLAIQITVLERRIAVIEALPAIAIEKDGLPAAKAELARLQRVEQGAVAEPEPKSSPRRTVTA